MRFLIPWLWTAGALQLVIIAANFILPEKLQCRVSYWRLWSDAIVHQVHMRVFRQIKGLAEAEEMQAAAKFLAGQ